MAAENGYAKQARARVLAQQRQAALTNCKHLAAVAGDACCRRCGARYYIGADNMPVWNRLAPRA